MAEGLVSEQESILRLYRGDALLAILSNIRLWDWPWYSCNFQPTSAFEQYQPLFERELELLEGKGAIGEWDLAYAKIEELGLTLSYPSEDKATNVFLLHIEDTTARFKAVFE